MKTTNQAQPCGGRRRGALRRPITQPGSMCAAGLQALQAGPSRCRHAHELTRVWEHEEWTGMPESRKSSERAISGTSAGRRRQTAAGGGGQTSVKPDACFLGPAAPPSPATGPWRPHSPHHLSCRLHWRQPARALTGGSAQQRWFVQDSGIQGVRHRTRGHATHDSREVDRGASHRQGDGHSRRLATRHIVSGGLNKGGYAAGGRSRSGVVLKQWATAKVLHSLCVLRLKCSMHECCLHAGGPNPAHSTLLEPHRPSAGMLVARRLQRQGRASAGAAWRLQEQQQHCRQCLSTSPGSKDAPAWVLLQREGGAATAAVGSGTGAASAHTQHRSTPALPYPA